MGVNLDTYLTLPIDQLTESLGKPVRINFIAAALGGMARVEHLVHQVGVQKRARPEGDALLSTATASVKLGKGLS
jgi:hypothetical protein